MGSLLSPFRQKQFCIPTNVQNAYEKFQKGRKHHHHKHQKFARWLHIDRALVKEREAFLQQIPTIHLLWPKAKYPPRRTDVCETEEIKAIWDKYHSGWEHPDPREVHAMGGTWVPTVVLDETKLQKVVEEGKSVIICNSKTGEIAGGSSKMYVVTQEFSNGSPVSYMGMLGGSTMSGCIFTFFHLTMLVNQLHFQKADPGHACQIGYTSGARSKLKLDWACNLVQKISQEDLLNLNYQSSLTFALFWNLIQSRLPPEIIKSFDSFLDKTGIPRMDVYKKVRSSEGNYMVSDLKDTYINLTQP